MGCALRIYRVNFKDSSDSPPPKSVYEARAHEEQGYFLSFLKEVEGFHKRRADVPADLDTKDIDPRLILQVPPVLEKKFSWASFEKFKCRMVVLGNHWNSTNSVDTSASMVGMDTLNDINAYENTDEFACRVDHMRY